MRPERFFDDLEEPRLVHVTDFGDFEKGIVYSVREDLGDLVGTRNMTVSERQVRMMKPKKDD